MQETPQLSLIQEVAPDDVEEAKALRQRVQRAYLVLGTVSHMDIAERAGVGGELAAIVKQLEELNGKMFRAIRKAKGNDASA